MEIQEQLMVCRLLSIVHVKQYLMQQQQLVNSIWLMVVSNYQLTIFSDMDVQRSTDFKFKQGMIAHRGSVFAGGNVISKMDSYVLRKRLLFNSRFFI